MDVEESVGKELTLTKSTYTIIHDTEAYNLKTIKIKKQPLKYAFVGGMWYTSKDFTLQQDISLPYPFSTYFTTKIPDKTWNNTLFRSLYYVKMPLLVLQFDDTCICIEFDPVIEQNGKEIIPFLSLSEDNNQYIISFYLFNEFQLIEKEHAWLGSGKKKTIQLGLNKDDTFLFTTSTKSYKKWTEAVQHYAKKHLETPPKFPPADAIFEQGKQALFRSYDHLTGSFLQLPWQQTPGFTLVHSSYSLMTSEAIRLHYFTKWYQQTKDEQYQQWSKDLRAIFTNPKLYKTDLRKGKGLVWYNMTNLTKKGLNGFFYMDCGYGGYPGGQGTIALHLLNYLSYQKDQDIETLVKQSLDYLLSTQKHNGSWPMAIRQEGIIRFRRENLEDYETSGGSAECIRALLTGYKRYNNVAMKNAALRGLSYLEKTYPICYNGLRDIGINEAEAFSSVSMIDAFLDAYEITKDNKYLEDALTYAWYSVPWIYYYDTKHLPLKFGFHPISYSITPRLSPYESMWIVSTYQRLHHLTKDMFWKTLAQQIYSRALLWVSENGGLSEGIFPNFLQEMKSLPMEQTFASVEMLQASTQYIDEKPIKKEPPKKVDIRGIRVEKQQNFLHVFYHDEEIMRFDASLCKVVFLKGVDLNMYGICFSFPEAYSFGNRLMRSLKHYIRGPYGKFLLSISELKFFLRGVHAPTLKKIQSIKSFERYIRSWNLSIDGGSIKGWCQTPLHKISYTIAVTKQEEEIMVSFDPLIIEVLRHDLPIGHTFVPLIGSRCLKHENERLIFDGFSVISTPRDVIKSDEWTAVDQSLVTNWTHGGIYKSRFALVLPQVT